MAKRNVQRERERRRALAYQERIRAKQARSKRNSIIAGVVTALLVAGLITGVVIWSNQPPKDQVADQTQDPYRDQDLIPEEGPTAPDPDWAEGRMWQGLIDTDLGAISIELDGAAAPQAVANFNYLATTGFYNMTQCHRLTTKGIYVLQCGSQTGDGTDGPGYTFGPVENAPEDGIYKRGVIAMARAQEEDSMGSQFFIVYQDSELPTPPGYTVFGTVKEGMQVIDDLAAEGVEPPGDETGDGRPAKAITINQIGVQ